MEINKDTILGQLKQEPNQREVRVVATLGIQKRDAEVDTPGDTGSGADGTTKNSRTIEGYAALYDSPTVLYESRDWKYIEVIAKGAFKGAIATSDIRALFNHDPNMVLGRTVAKTLEVSDDEKGLHFQFDAPGTTYGNDLLISIERGDVTQASFAFTVEEWQTNSKELPDGTEEYTRTILKVKEIFDISPVTYPAYKDTETSLRAQITSLQKPEKSQPENSTDWADYIQSASAFYK